MRKQLVLAGILLPAITLAAGDHGIAWPDGYRHWTYVKSMVIEAGHPLYAQFGGIHHLYANQLAMQGYRTGKFPDGAEIVFDLLAANAADHAVTEGGRKFIGVMRHDSKRYATTGGWGFEAFKGDSHDERMVGDKAATACFSCHASQKAYDYVFSHYPD